MQLVYHSGLIGLGLAYSVIRVGTGGTPKVRPYTYRYIILVHKCEYLDIKIFLRNIDDTKV